MHQRDALCPRINSPEVQKNINVSKWLQAMSPQCLHLGEGKDGGWPIVKAPNEAQPNRAVRAYSGEQAPPQAIFSIILPVRAYSLILFYNGLHHKMERMALAKELL